MKLSQFFAAVIISSVLIFLRSEMLSAQELPAPGLKYLLKDYGARVDWSDTNQLLVYDRVRPETYFRIATMDKDGGNQKCPPHRGRWLLCQPAFKSAINYP